MTVRAGSAPNSDCTVQSSKKTSEGGNQVKVLLLVALLIQGFKKKTLSGRNTFELMRIYALDFFSHHVSDRQTCAWVRL